MKDYIIAVIDKLYFDYYLADKNCVINSYFLEN